MSVSHLILFFKQKTAYECRCSDWSSDVCSSELVDVTVLEDKLSRIVRNWQDDLREELVAAEGEERGLKTANRYGRALPTGYIEQVTPEIAARDRQNAVMGKRVSERIDLGGRRIIKKNNKRKIQKKIQTTL